eukprot:m51a1_g10620 hypothetical protein (692) ;mRNA; f:59447-62102
MKHLVFLNISAQSTNVELPSDIYGNIKTACITHWDLNKYPSGFPPFIQLKFTGCFETRRFTVELYGPGENPSPLAIPADMAFRAHLEGLVGGKIYPQISDSQDVTFPIGYNAQRMPPIVENAAILNAYGLNANATVSVTDEDMKVLKDKSDMLTQAKLDLQMIDFVKPWKDPPTLAYFISNFGPIVDRWKEFIGKRFDTAKEYEMLKFELPNYENMAKRIAFTEVSEIQDVINSPGGVLRDAEAANAIQHPLGEKFTRGFFSPYEMKRLIETVGLTSPFKPVDGPVGNPQQSRINQRKAQKTKEVEWKSIVDDSLGSKINTDSLPDLQEWDPRSLPNDFFLVLEGRRRIGKSTFAKWLLQWYQDKFSLVWCMTQTKSTHYWDEFVGDAFTFDSWYPSCIAKLIERNDAIIAKYGETSDKARELGSALVILDDVISAKVHDDPMFRKLAVEGRHHLISIILMTQDPKAIGPCVRDNADVAVIFNQKTFRNKESIWADFMNDTTKDLARAMMAKYCVEHNALVAIQTNLNADITQNFFKTTGDKTKLQDSTYALGSVEQKKIIFAERRKREEDARRHEAEGITARVTAEDIKKVATVIDERLRISDSLKNIPLLDDVLSLLLHVGILSVGTHFCSNAMPWLVQDPSSFCLFMMGLYSTSPHLRVHLGRINETIIPTKATQPEKKAQPEPEASK